MKKKRLFGLILVTMTFVLLINFTVVAETMTIATPSDALTLDPIMLSETPTISVQMNIFEGLVHLDENLDVQPGLASSWEVENDTTWLFHLRKGVKFHNGDNFDAEDVKFSIERAQNHPKSQFKSPVGQVESVEIRDDYTVAIKTTFPYPILPRKIGRILICSKDYVEANSDQHLQNNAVGTGPYQVSSWEKDEEMVLTFYEDYWGEKPEVDKAILKPISNPATRVSSFLSGEVDILLDLPVQDVERVEEAEGVKVVTRPGMRLIFLGFDTQEGPFSKLKVRKAVYHAVNEDAIVEHVMNGHAYKAGQFYPDTIFGYNPDIKRVPYDPEKAKQLLAEAGYPDGFTIQFDSSNDRYMNDGQIAQAVAIQLARVGINVELNVQTKSAHFDKILSRNTDFYLLGWTNSNGDGIQFLDGLLHSPEDSYGRFNLGNYSNEEVDKLIEEAARTLDDEKRSEIMQEAVRIGMEEVAYLPLHYQQQLYGMKENIKWTPRPDKYVKIYTMGFDN